LAGSNNLTNFDHLRKIVNIEDTPNGFLKIPGIPVILPTLEWFLQRIENNDPYHFLRVNHATIDKYCWKFIISNATKIADNMGGVPTNPWENQLPLSKLDEYLTEGKYQEIWEGLMSQNSFGYFVNQKTHGEKLRTFIDVFHQNKDISPKFDIGISLGVGLGTIWGRYAQEHPLQTGRFRVVNLFSQKTNHMYFHSGVLRHFAIMGELPKLFNRLNDLGHQIVFLGPAYMKHFQQQYNIKNFHHIVTPLRTALDGYGDNIKEVQKIRDDYGKTILLHSTGHVAAGWIAYQLKDDMDIWGLDIGRSFDLDIVNKVKNDKSVTFPTQWTSAIDLNRAKDHIKRLRG